MLIHMGTSQHCNYMFFLELEYYKTKLPRKYENIY